MYLSLQTVCGCHGYLSFESIHCDRCRSLIPYQVSDESLIDPVATSNMLNGVHMKSIQGSKQTSTMLIPYEKQNRQQHRITTGRIRFRALCPFCNNPAYVLRYYCKRERLYFHLRIQNFSENEQSVYSSVAESQNKHGYEQHSHRHSRKDSSYTESIEDSYSLTDSTYHRPPSTILYDQSGLPSARDVQNENEKRLYALNELEGDLFNVLRNGLFYDTIIQCQDNVKLQVHRCILGGRSPWFRHLLGEYHDSDTQDDYILQISIDDVASDVMNEILNFIYTNRCLISLKNASELLIASKRFEIEKLRKQVADFLLYRLTVENAIEMLISAHEAGAESLKTACIRLINRNAEKIKRTEKWRTFKTQYVDLVPELYESRVERLEPVRTTYLPDVFTAAAVPSESLRTLTKLYENPVKQRLASLTVRTLAASTKPPPSRSPTPVVQIHEQIHPDDQISMAKSGSFAHQYDQTLRSAVDRGSSMKKPIITKTRRHPIPTPAAPSSTRTVFPTVKQNSDIDIARRPVNTYEKSATQPINTRKQQSIHSHVPQKPSPPSIHRKPPLPAFPHKSTSVAPQKVPPPVQQKVPPPPPRKPSPPTQQRLPSPVQPKSPSPIPQKSPPLAPTKVSRGVSPRYVIEIRESPTLTDVAPEEHMTRARLSSTDMTD